MDLRQRIIIEAGKLFLDNGIRAITMDDIAKSLGISKRTVYENFLDKEMLLLESVKQIIAMRQERERLLLHKESHYIEFFLHCHTEMVSQLNIMNRNFLRELKRSYPNVYKLFEADGEKKIREQIEMLEKGKEQGLIRREVNAEISSLLIKAQFEMLWHSDVFKMNNYTFSEVLSNITLNFVRGIATLKGLEMIDQYIEKNASPLLSPTDSVCRPESIQL